MTQDSLAGLRLHLVGCGKMGSALVKGWIKAGLKPENISAKVVTDMTATKLSSELGIRVTKDAKYDGQDVVILAVKPQILMQVLQENWTPAPTKPLYLSLAAGIRLKSLEAALPNARVIRTMPNTPSLVDQGMSTLCAGSHNTENDYRLAEQLFASVGKTAWVETEALLDAATAIAGSGPAYVFYFMECLIQLAQELGIPEKAAHTLVTQTFKGSLALAETEGWNLTELRQNVMSKGGVTEAAMRRLAADESGLKELFDSALHLNIKRAQELGS